MSDHLFRADVDGLKLFQRDDGLWSLYNWKHSGGLSVEFSDSDLLLLRFLLARVAPYDDSSLMTCSPEQYEAFQKWKAQQSEEPK